MHCISIQVMFPVIHSVKVFAWGAGTYDAYLHPVTELASGLLKHLQALAGSEVY